MNAARLTRPAAFLFARCVAFALALIAARSTLIASTSVCPEKVAAVWTLMDAFTHLHE
jgi:hypothetical protein